MPADDAYRGLPGAFPYAFRASDSLLFKSYVVLGGLFALVVVALFALGLVELVAETLGAGSGTFTFQRAFFVFVGALVVAPIVAPVLFVARRHRRLDGAGRYDAALGALGYLFAGSLYLGLVVSTPPAFQRDAGPVLDALYALPPAVGAVPPIAVAVAIYLVGRRW